MVDRLPSELVRFIGLKLDSTADRIRFRAVSKSWRSVLPFRRPPMLMVATLTPYAIRFLNVGEEHFFTIPLSCEDSVLGYTSNWVITVNTVDTPPTTIICSNIFSTTQFQLPPPPNVLPPSGEVPVPASSIKVVLSPSVAAVGIFWNVSGFLAIARHGEKIWTPVAAYPNMGRLFFEDCVFYQQRIYAISSKGVIVACDTGDDSDPPRLEFLLDCSAENATSPWRKHYLVEVSGELLMVVRFFDGNDKTNQFKLYKLDLGNMSFEELKCLGDHSLFLGRNASTSVLATDYFGLECLIWRITTLHRIFNQLSGGQFGSSQNKISRSRNYLLPSTLYIHHSLICLTSRTSICL